MKNEPLNWQRQINPDQGAFFYPPTMGVFAIPIALAPWDIAKHLLSALNIIALLGILFFCAQICKRLLGLPDRNSRIWLGLGIGCLMSAVPETIYTGQTPLLSMVGCLGAVYYLLQNRLLACAVCIVIASTKPQLSLIPVIYLLIASRSWLLFIYSSACVAACSIVIFLIGGDHNPLTVISNLADTHASLTPNSPANFPGLYWLMTYMGLPESTNKFSPIAGVIITLGLAIWSAKKQHINQPQQLLLLLCICCSITSLFMPLHGYDYVVLLLALVMLTTNSQGIYWWAVIGPCMLLITRPDNVAYSLLQPIIGTHIGHIPVNSVMLESLAAAGLLGILITMLLKSISEKPS